VAISDPEGKGSQAAMVRALAASRVEPEAVDYVSAHATSTVIGDASEARALKAVFGKSRKRPAISSTKALTGHGLSLAGAMECGFCALAIREGFAPGSAHISRLDAECAGLNIIRETLPSGPAVVLKNSSGFGGANVAVLFRRL
jgi:3-oxoacyl-[acyl-carrier-protein] synthase-1